jgi:hypothetical protein
VIAQRLLALVLAPCLACASFDAEIIEPVDPSLAAGSVHHTSFELQPSSSRPSSSPTTTTTTTTTQPTAGAPQPTTTPGTTGTTTTPTTTTTTTTTPGGPTPVAGTGAGGPAPAGAATAPKIGDEATVDRPAEPDKAQRRRNGLFWAGVALTAIGGAGVIGLGVGGRVTQAQIAKGYDDDDLTHAREKELRDRGEGMNIGAATSGAVGILGVALFSIALGVDYVRCGTLTTKRRKDCVPRPRRR